jgi:RNA polymerase sigma factor (sigma-70 family)
MALARLRKAVEYLRRVGGGASDEELLERFLGVRESDAFEALVHRHGPMVFGVCRRILHHHHDAEDAFQATFLVLACKAASIRPRNMIANWLYGVAYRTALKARAICAKRRAKQRMLCDMADPRTAQESDDLRDLLDRELSHLPDKYRTPIVLCDLEGRSRAEAANQLGWSAGTLSGRLARARRMLAKRLNRHGLSSVVAAGLFSGPVSASLVSVTVKAATGQAVVPAHVAALTKGVLNAMIITRLKTVMGLILVLALLGIGTGFWLRQSSAIAQVPPPPVEIQRQHAKGAWEYKALMRTEIEMRAPKESGTKLTDGLNDLAGAGWELAGIDPGDTGVGGLRVPSTYIFRRAKGGPVLPLGGAVR